MANHSEGKSVLIVALQLSLAAAMFLATANANKNDHFFTLDPKKSSRCHYPEIMNCNNSMYPILDYQEGAWFYHTPFRSCRPLYVATSINDCPKDRDLFRNREECERICGEPCGDKGAEKGICTMEEFCESKNKVHTYSSHPCEAYGVKCCKSSYVESGTTERHSRHHNSNAQQRLRLQKQYIDREASLI